MGVRRASHSEAVPVQPPIATRTPNIHGIQRATAAGCPLMRRAIASSYACSGRRCATHCRLRLMT